MFFRPGLKATASAVAITALLGACSDGSDNFDDLQRAPSYDFAAVDAAMQRFIDDSDTLDGISY